MTADLGFDSVGQHTFLGANLLLRDMVDHSYGIDPAFEDIVRV